MHLLKPLASGVEGAEDGTVDVYQRGTTTRATYYTAFDGSGATTPTGSITLDSNGAAILYVNEICDVIVKDDGGVIIHTFTSSPSAAAVEVISRSFTGVDYTTGQSGASKPTDLQTVLDRLYTSFGALDFNVLVGGVSTSVQNAFSGIATLYFNVMSAAYGATGDGVTNDVTAIQAAIDAAEAAGGGIVFFPRGTYKINSTLNVKSTVSLLGVGAAGSIITSAAVLLTMEASATYVTSVEGLRLVSTSSACIDASAGRRLRVLNCYFDNSAGGAGDYAVSGGSTNVGVCYLSECTFVANSAGSVLNGATTAFLFHVYGCKFVAPAAPSSEMVRAYGGSVIACEFDVSAMAGGTLTLVNFFVGAAGLVASGAVVSCSCGNPAAGTVTAIPAVNGRATDGFLTIGNVWGSSVVHVSSISDATKANYFGQQDFDRDRGRYYVADDTAAVAIDAGQYASAEVERTTNGNQTVTLGSAGAVNRDFALVYYNNQGAGSGTITMAGPVLGLTTFTVNANCISYYFFKSQHRGTAEHWVLVGSSLNIAE